MTHRTDCDNCHGTGIGTYGPNPCPCNQRDCWHGYLARSCDDCWNAKEIRRLETANRDLETRLHEAVRLLRGWEIEIQPHPTSIDGRRYKDLIDWDDQRGNHGR